MTVAVAPRETVPADIRPAEVELAFTAILLRAGIYGEAVPVYAPTGDPRAMPIAWRRVWGRINRG